MRSTRMKMAASATAAMLGAGMIAGAATAGGFLTGSRITYPTGYTGNGATLDINVCIAPGTIDAEKMLQPVGNAVAQWNRSRPASSNVRNFFLPSNKIDFESVALHELGHCIGLSHPNLGGQVSEGAVAAAVSTNGNNETFDLDPGADGIYGSPDDVRGDDENLFYFRRQINNPFTIAGTVDSSTYTRDVADLPATDLFPATSEISVAKLSRYDTPFTEAIMQHDINLQQLGRHTSHDDVSILRYGMSGLDQIEGTSDDYRINLVNKGISNDDNCDITLVSNSTGLASCNVGLRAPADADYWIVTDGTIRFNSNIDWFFNEAPPCNKSVVLLQNEWKMFSLPCDVGISTSATIADILGDDLGVDAYQDTWFLYKLVYAENGSGDVVADYVKPSINDELKAGEAYWLYTTLAGQVVDVSGEYTAQFDVPLFKPSNSKRGWNLVGTPFRIQTPWPDTEVVLANGEVLGLPEADPGPNQIRQSACTKTAESDDCIMAKFAFKWIDQENGYELLTPTRGGLNQFEGAWVATGREGSAIRFHMTNAERNSL